MKIVNQFIGSISAFAGILLVILILVNCILVQDDFLNGTNSKYDVPKKLAVAEEELQTVVHAMISYVKGQTDSPQVVVTIKDTDTEFFNQKELGHLADVRQLIHNIRIITGILCIVAILGMVYLIREKAYKQIAKGVLYAWGIMLVGVVAVGIIAMIDINLVITGFHKLCFSNANWVLNPALDRSVWMFRTNMYVDVLLTMIGIIGTVAVVTIGGAVYYIKKNR